MRLTHRHCHHGRKFARGEELNTLQHRINEVVGISGPIVQIARRVDGYKAEDKFAEAWRTSHPWIQKVVRTSDPLIDQHRHTDFTLFLKCESGLSIPVDVKASVHAQTYFVETHQNLRVPLLLIIADANASLLEIKRRTINGIRQWLRVNRMNRILRELPQCPSLS